MTLPRHERILLPPIGAILPLWASEEIGGSPALSRLAIMLRLSD